MTADRLVATPRWNSARAATAFWIVAATSVLLLIGAWLWYGFVGVEEMTEQCKAVAASSTTEGLLVSLGLVPLVIAHLGALAVLALIARSRATSVFGRFVYCAIVLGAASVIAIIVVQIPFGGELFEMSAAHADCGSFEVSR